jgi:hypothetical protein
VTPAVEEAGVESELDEVAETGDAATPMGLKRRASAATVRRPRTGGTP